MALTREIPLCDAAFCVTDSSDCRAAIAVASVSENCVAITSSWRITRPGAYAVRAALTLPFASPELCIPSVLYKNNNCGQGAFPKGGIGMSFAFREERTPLPGCVLLKSGNDFAAFCIAPCSSHDEAAHVCAYCDEGRTAIEMQMPAQEYPFSYEGKTRTVRHAARARDFIAVGCSPEKPLVLERTCFVFSKTIHDADANAFFSLYREFSQCVARRVVQLAHRQTRGDVNPISWDEWFSRKLKHLEFLTEKNEDGTAYIRMGKGNGVLQHIYDFTAASFLVKSIEGAVVFAKSGNSALAEAIGRYFLRAEQPRGSGVFRDNYSIARNEWGGYLGVSEHSDYASFVNARCNGEAMSAYVALYETLAAHGKKIAEFIELPKRVAQFYLAHQIRDSSSEWCGSFGRWWSADGASVNGCGTNGAHIVSFLIALFPHCDDVLKNRIAESLNMAAAYYRRMIARAEYYGDTLDADSFDKESGAVLLRESLDMHDFTGNTAFLDDAKKAADFVYTWLWQYDVPFPDSAPLAKEHFKTRGMTSVSVAHHHLDFYGMYIARDFLRLAQKCGNAFYCDAARSMMNACRQLVASKENALGKSAEFEGWQPEQINHTQWDYFDRADCMHGWYDICIAWEVVLTLGAYMQIRESFPFAAASY